MVEVEIGAEVEVFVEGETLCEVMFAATVEVVTGAGVDTTVGVVEDVFAITAPKKSTTCVYQNSSIVV